MTAENNGEHHEVIRGSIGHYGLSTSELELKTPLPLHLDHTHSVYVAVGTLISAMVIVAIAVIGLALYSIRLKVADDYFLINR